MKCVNYTIYSVADRRVDGTSGRLTKIAGNYQSLMICFGIGNYEEQDQAININNVKFKLIQILAFKLLLLQVNTTIKKFGTRYTPGNAVVEVITFVRRINKLIFKYALLTTLMRKDLILKYVMVKRLLL